MFVRDDTWNAVKQFPAEAVRCHMPLCIGYKEDHYTPSELFVLANDMSQRGYDFSIYLVPNDQNRAMVLQKWYNDNAELVDRYPANIKIISEWRKETSRWQAARDVLLPVLDLVSDDVFDETVPSTDPAHVLASHLRADIDKKGVRARFPDETDARIYAHMIDEMADCVAFMVPRLHDITKPVLICNSATIHIQAIIKAMLTNKLLSKQQLFLKCVQTHIVHPALKLDVETNSCVQLQQVPSSPTISDLSIQRKIAERQLEDLIRKQGTAAEIDAAVQVLSALAFFEAICRGHIEMSRQQSSVAVLGRELSNPQPAVSPKRVSKLSRESSHHTLHAYFRATKSGSKPPLSRRASDKAIYSRPKSVDMSGRRVSDPEEGSRVFIPITVRYSPYPPTTPHFFIGRCNRSNRRSTLAPSFERLNLQDEVNAVTTGDPTAIKTPNFS